MSNQVSYTNLRVGVGKFFYGTGCIHELANEIIRLGGKPFIIGGKTTTPLVMSYCEDEIKAAGINPIIKIHEGACSKAFANCYLDEAQKNKCSVIVGLGGGKILDLCKCIATFGNMDIINVPTSIATCVASSSVCIMYTNEGASDGSVAMNKEVDVVIADTDLIATAPKRTLAAGILDSLAKLPEVVHKLEIKSYQDCQIEKYICTINSRGIYDFLMGEAVNVYDNGIASERLTDVILTNLLHTSVVSGFSCGTNQLALAHCLYDFMRTNYTKEAAGIMHGEIVAVGLLMQMRFNNNSQDEINKMRNLMSHMKMPLTLSEIGFLINEENINKLIDYLIPRTALTKECEPALRQAIKEIC